MADHRPRRVLLTTTADADALQRAGRLAEAIDLYREIFARDPTDEAAWYGIGCAHLARREHADAARTLAQAQALRPGDATALNLGRALFQLGYVDRALAQFRAVAVSPDATLAEMARQNIACIIPGAAVNDRAIREARRQWAAFHAAAPVRPAPAGDRRRIGYISAFFGDANWMKPVWGVINHHDRDRFELHLIADRTLPSAAGGYHDHDRDHVHDITDVPNRRAAEIVASLGLDILVDLNGYSFTPRLPLVMRRPARCVVAWFNMFAPSGLDAIDWLVGDAEVIPPGDEAAYGERIHRVPGSYLAFAVGYDVPEVAPLPYERAGVLTFGCLCSQYKLTDEVLAGFATILRAAPRSLLLLRNAALDDPATRVELLARLGIDPARVRLQGRAPHLQFLQTYADIDVALDTFPYNGGTTTTEALWQGVPVLTFCGDRWAARTSASLLRAGGLAGWVMPDAAAMVDRAVRLTDDPDAPRMLSELRRTMRARLRASAACDAAGLCRALEAFYETAATAPSASST